MPTLAGLIGFPVPTDRHLDGLDQRALIFGQDEAGVRRTVPYYHLFKLQALRHDQWKYVLPNASKGAELYDLSNDIGETTNLASSQTDVVAEMERLVAAELALGLNPEIAKTRAETEAFQGGAKRKSKAK